MKFIKKASVVALSVLSISMANASTYTQTGTLQCDMTSEELKDKKTVILFVNGIQNSLADAESSRKALKNIGVCDEASCDFRKSYNPSSPKKFMVDPQPFLEDKDELRTIGSIEFSSLRNASIHVLNELETIIEKTLQTQYGNLLENGEITINDHKTTVKKLKEINKARIEEMIKIQKNAYDNDSLLFVPDKHGTNFETALSNFLKKSNAMEDSSSSDNKAYEFFARVVFLKQKKYLNNQFFFQYRQDLTTVYYSGIDPEKFTKSNGKPLPFFDDALQNVKAAVELLQSNITEFVLAGKKVVVVAHSQGNHIIELAYAKLAQEQNADFMKAIRVVGVAPVASTTPNNAYILWDEDHVVLDMYKTASFANPLKANFLNATSFWRRGNDFLRDHSFEKVYLANNIMGNYTIPTNIHDYSLQPTILKDKNTHSSLDIVKALIKGAMDSAQPITAQIETNSLLTAQLRWDHYDDMDLHIIEPFRRALSTERTQVFWGNQFGYFGELDLDDTDGDGPEHYYIKKNSTCNTLSEKTWDFYIHQHPKGNHKATAHFMLKIGNNRVTSHSFNKNHWAQEDRPSILAPNHLSKHPSVTVTFAPYKEKSKTLDYTITVKDGVTNLDNGENNNNNNSGS